MGKTKQGDEEAMRICGKKNDLNKSEKHKLSDIRWRKAVANSFDALKASLVHHPETDCGEDNEQTKIRPMPRVSTLEHTIDYIVKMEAHISDLLQKEAKRNGYSIDADSLPAEYTLNYYRQAFSIMEEEFTPCPRRTKGNKTVTIEDVQRQKVEKSLRELKQTRFSSLFSSEEGEGADESMMNLSPEESIQDSDDSLLSGPTLKREPAPETAIFMPCFTLPANINPHTCCYDDYSVFKRNPYEDYPSLVFDSTMTFFPSAISVNTSSSQLHYLPSSTSIDFFPTCSQIQPDTGHEDMKRSKFAPNRFSEKVKRKLDMDNVEESGKSEFVKFLYGSASGDGPSSCTRATKHCRSLDFKSSELVIPQGDVMQLSDDLKEINLCDFGLNNVNLASVYDFDAEENFPSIKQPAEITGHMDFSSSERREKVTNSIKSFNLDEMEKNGSSTYESKSLDFLFQNKIFPLNSAYQHLVNSYSGHERNITRVNMQYKGSFNGVSNETNAETTLPPVGVPQSELIEFN